MPIWEYYCNRCNAPYATIVWPTRPFSTKCPDCGDQGERIVSCPAIPPSCTTEEEEK